LVRETHHEVNIAKQISFGVDHWVDGFWGKQ
jgi:hypothetical protein